MTEKGEKREKEPAPENRSEGDPSVIEAEAQAPLEKLQAQVEEAKRQAAEHLDGWKRTQAEFANYRKRLEREQGEALARMTGRVMARIFPVLDDFERALKERVSPEALDRWVDGVRLIHEKLLAVLEAEGVRTIQSEGEQFDPLRHEALSYEPSRDHQDGQVIEVVRPGYRLGETVLRPALVRVARAEGTPPPAAGKAADKTGEKRSE